MKKTCVRDNFKKNAIKWEKFRGGGTLQRGTYEEFYPEGEGNSINSGGR